MRRSIVLASIAAAALGAGLLQFASRLEQSSPKPVAVHDVEPSASVTPLRGRSHEASPPIVPAPVLPPIDPDRRALAQPDGPGAPGAMAETIEYPRAAKLADSPLSAIPHTVVGAWDDAPDSPELGARRAFILVVEPGLADEVLADLARDVRDSHLDAEWLTIRVFDSEAGATRPSWTDGGKTRDAHMVAELRRNTAGQGEWLKVRGREVDL